MARPHFTLSEHAFERQRERVGLDAKAFCERAERAAVLAIHVSAGGQYWLLWVKELQRAHVFMADTDGCIRTVFPALKANGKGGVVKDERRAMGYGRIKSRVLLAALEAAGATKSDAAGLLAAMQRHEATLVEPRQWNYVWLLRYTILTEEGAVASKVARLGKTLAAEHASAALLARARALLAGKRCTSATLSLEQRDDGSIAEAIELAG